MVGSVACQPAEVCRFARAISAIALPTSASRSNPAEFPLTAQLTARNTRFNMRSRVESFRASESLNGFPGFFGNGNNESRSTQSSSMRRRHIWSKANSGWSAKRPNSVRWSVMPPLGIPFRDWCLRRPIRVLRGLTRHIGQLLNGLTQHVGGNRCVKIADCVAAVARQFLRDALTSA